MITIEKFTYNPFQENTYILYDETKECIIIDPGCFSKEEKVHLLSFIEDNQLKPVQLLNTHCHVDHIQGNYIISRDYNLKLNKKLKKLARKSALSLKAKEKAITVVEDFEFKSPKTKDFVKVINSLDLDSKKPLFIFAALNKNVYLSSRNLKNSKVIIASELNTYSISNASNLILDESAVMGIVNVLKK